MPGTLRLMADYECFPLWLPDGDGDLDPAELNLSAHLTARLLAWADAFDSTLDMDNAPAPLHMRPLSYRMARTSGTPSSARATPSGKGCKRRGPTCG